MTTYAFAQTDYFDDGYSTSSPTNSVASTEMALVPYEAPRMPTQTIQEPDVAKMKRRRRRNSVVAGVTCGVIGTIALGPVGGIAGGVGGAMAAKAVGKRKERRKMAKYNAQMNGSIKEDSILVESGSFA